MFRPIRRKTKEISTQAAQQLLLQQRRGVLAVNGDDGYPYAMPINYYYDVNEQKIYFHGAKAGHKHDALLLSNKVCFTVYGNESIKDEPWAPYVQSTIVFGCCHMLENTPAAMAQLKQLAAKYYPSEALIDAEIKKDGKAVQLYVIEIEHISGKQIQEK